VDTVDGTTVIRFNDRQLFDDRTVREVTEQILLVLPELKPGDGLVLDFSGVTTVSSSMVGKLVLLQRHSDNRGARLRLCELNEPIAAVMRTTNLDRIFQIDRDLRESLSMLALG
jgi:anti-sigma B factor antagonist